MFNEILTGRASLEPKRPVPPTPPIGGELLYRDEMRTCASCNREFLVLPTSHHSKCVPCNLAAIQQAQQESDRMLAAANQRQRSNDGTWNTLRWILAIAVILGLAFFRYGMRKQMAEDDAVMHGHRPSY